MAGTVTVTFANEDTYFGTSLKVVVLTGAIESGGAQAAGEFRSGAPNWTFTPGYSNSGIYFTVYDETGGVSGQYTAAASNALLDNGQAGDAYCDGHYTGTVTANSAVTAGCSAPSGPHIQLYASYEIRPSSGSTPTQDGSTPAGVASATTSATTASFSPPAGAVLIAIAGGNNAMSSGAISDTFGGLNWTLRSTWVSTATGAVSIWTATVSGVQASAMLAGAGLATTVPAVSGLSGSVKAAALLAGAGAALMPVTASSQVTAALAGAGQEFVSSADKGGGVVISAAGLFPGRPPNPLNAKVELFLNGTWTDITPFVLVRDTISITNMGRTDESASISAAQLALTLNNTDARFTPLNPGSPYYPYIQRNTRIRLSLHPTSAAGVTYSGYRFNGEVSAWPTAQNTSGKSNYVQLTGAGIWRRISQNQANIGSAYTRYLGKLSGLDVPASAWSMEDGQGKQFVLTAGGGQNAGFTGTPSFQSDSTSFPGSDSLPALNGARITAPVSSAATPTSNVTRFALSVPAGGDSTAGTTSAWNLSETDSSGTVAKLESYLQPAGHLGFQGLSSGGAVLFTGQTNVNVQGVPVLVSLELTPSGGNINWAFRVIKPGATAVLESHTGTISGSIAAVTQVKLNRSGALSNTVAGQLGVWYDNPSLVTAAQALGGWAGELAVSRFVRICNEELITPTVIGVNSPQMGPQQDGTLAAVLQTIEDTDGGLLFEPRDMFGLGYRTLSSMMNQSAAVALDYGNGQLGAPLAPVYDDQLLRNQWTVTNTPDGYVAQATLESGAVSVLPPPNGAGLYAATATTNAYADAQVNAIAQHRLFLGTIDDQRFPQLAVNMARPQAAGLFQSVPGLRVGDYLQVTDVPATIDANVIHQLAYGYSEVISHNQWTLTFNCIPEQPFETGFSPGTYQVVQGTSAQPTGSTTTGGAIAAGAIGLNSLATAVSARGIGGSTSFVAGAPPFDWSFAVSLTPASSSYFIATAVQAQPIAPGDTFTSSAGYGGPFTVTQVSLDPNSPGYADVYFTPDASSPMVSGTVTGGKNGDIWINQAAGNQLQQWSGGQWNTVKFGPQAVSFSAGGALITVGPAAPASPNTGDIWYDAGNGYRMNQWNGSSWQPFQWGTTSIQPNSVTTPLLAAGAVATQNLAAGAVTAGTVAANAISASAIQAGAVTANALAAGIIYGGIVDGTQINGATFRALNAFGATIMTVNRSDGTWIEYIDTGSSTQGYMVSSSAHTAGTDEFGNAYLAGLAAYNVSGGNYLAVQDVNGNTNYLSATAAGGPWTTYSSIQPNTITGWIGYFNSAGDEYNVGHREGSGNVAQHITSTSATDITGSDVNVLANAYRITHDIFYYVGTGGGTLGALFSTRAGAGAVVGFVFEEFTFYTSSSITTRVNSATGQYQNNQQGPTLAGNSTQPMHVRIEQWITFTSAGTAAVFAAVGGATSDFFIAACFSRIEKRDFL